MYEIKVDDSRLTGPLEQIIAGVHDASPLMRIITGVMVDEVEENFAQEGRPKWLGLQPGTIAARTKDGTWPGKILQRSGQLASSMEEFSDAHTAMVGTNKKYAAIQNFGGKTGPHVITPRNKKALAFGGRVVKRVNHPGSVIPARPFMTISEGGMDDILGHTNSYLRNLAL